MAGGWHLSPRFRVIRDEIIALGPGKADLIEAIGRTGSIGDAAESLEMSYMRAWKLVRTINDSFREPVIEASRGGKERGGATVTEFGRRLVSLYRQIEAKAATATAEDWSELKRMLR